MSLPRAQPAASSGLAQAETPSPQVARKPARQRASKQATSELAFYTACASIFSHRYISFRRSIGPALY